MRWVVGMLCLLVMASIGLSLVHRREETFGARLLAQLDKAGRVRGAIAVLDYVPGEMGIPQERVEQRGVATGLGVPDEQFLRGGPIQFHWRQAPASEQILRKSFWVGGAARAKVRDALSESGYFENAGEARLNEAASDVAALSDEELFNAWLSADRAVLAETDDPRRAVREAELLMAADDPGAVVMFSRGRCNVYVYGGDRGSAATWCEMEAFDAEGKMRWSGTLRVGGTPAPEEMRRDAVWAFDAAIGSR